MEICSGRANGCDRLEPETKPTLSFWPAYELAVLEVCLSYQSSELEQDRRPRWIRFRTPMFSASPTHSPNLLQVQREFERLGGRIVNARVEAITPCEALEQARTSVGTSECWRCEALEQALTSVALASVGTNIWCGVRLLSGLLDTSMRLSRHLLTHPHASSMSMRIHPCMCVKPHTRAHLYAHAWNKFWTYLAWESYFVFPRLWCCRKMV